MAILKIARMGHPVLRKIAEPVENASAPEIVRLVVDMIETMIDAGGQGLAAPQVHVSSRVIVYFPPPPEDADDDFERTPRVLINPEITPLNDAVTDGWEGCLSVPEMRGVVPRHTTVKLRALDLQGGEIEEDLADHHARVVQHECDHLDGILYPQRMTDLSTLMFESEVKYAIAEAAARRETTAEGETTAGGEAAK